MPRYLRPHTTAAEARATCPECGATVRVVGTRWLLVHNVGSPEYTYTPGSGYNRCLGSLMPVRPSARSQASR